MPCFRLRRVVVRRLWEPSKTVWRALPPNPKSPLGWLASVGWVIRIRLPRLHDPLNGYHNPEWYDCDKKGLKCISGLLFVNYWVNKTSCVAVTNMMVVMMICRRLDINFKGGYISDETLWIIKPQGTTIQPMKNKNANICTPPPTSYWNQELAH